MSDFLAGYLRSNRVHEYMLDRVAKTVSFPRSTPIWETYEMSHPSTSKRTQVAYAKRSKPVEASSQPAPSKRPHLPLPPVEKTSNNGVLRESNTQPRGDQERHPKSDAAPSLRPRAFVDKTLSDKEKAQLFSVVCDEVKQMKQRSSKLAEERRKVDQDRERLAEELREAKCRYCSV